MIGLTFIMWIILSLVGYLSQGVSYETVMYFTALCFLAMCVAEKKR